jgi:transposase
MEFGRDLFKQGYTTDEIAKKVGRPTSAVRKWVKDLRKGERAEERTKRGKYDKGVTDRVWRCLTENCDDEGNTTMRNCEIAEAIGSNGNSVCVAIIRLLSKEVIASWKSVDETGTKIIRTINVIKPYENDEVEESIDEIEESNDEPVSEDKWETLYRQNDAIIVYLKKIERLLEEFNSKL